jgi:type IV pilus assembly protein PilB
MLISNEQLKNLILKEGLIDSKKLEEIFLFAQSSNITLTDALIENDIISDESLGPIIAKYLKIPFVVLSRLTIPPELYHIVPENVAKKQKIIVFKKEDNNIHLAMTDPSNTQIQEMISKKTGKKIIPYLATERDIENALKIYRKDVQKTFNLMISDDPEKLGMISEDTPVAQIADLLIEYAYQDKASDIHIEPDEKHCLIRFRLDGILHDVLFLPKNLHERIVTRIKVLSKLRTDEHLTPQDGKMRMKLEKENLDIRVSIIPVAEGEKVVLRLLSSRSRRFSLVDLGMGKEDLKKVTNAFNKSFGTILSTGPTGCGKTTTIYAILKILNTREKNITTIEDPVEYRISGVNQIQVNPKANLNFANGLRSILRQDPNIIFVGEIRDNDTAAIAINAALTGHLVLTTLHTNDASTAIPRFMDMKIEPFLLASTINIIIAQRLVRKICEVCKKPLLMKTDSLAKNLPVEVIKRNFGSKEEIKTYQGEGCKICHSTGYSGRVGIFEVIEINNRIRKLISEKSDAQTILSEAVRGGMTTMLDDGLQKSLKGETTIEEVLRVTRVESL